MNKNLKENSLVITLIFPLLLIFYEVSVYLSNDMYLPALPQIIHSLNASRYLVQMTLSSWFFGAISLQLILGPISDRFGRRSVLLINGLVFVIASIICASTHQIMVLLVARFFEGMGVCGISVAGYACIHELFEHKKAIQTIAWMGSITVLAPAAGPLFGSLVLHLANWRMIFWILASTSSVALIFLFYVMPETKTEPTPIFFKPIMRGYGELLSTPGFVINVLISGFLFSGMILWITSGPLLVIEKFKYTPFYFGIFQACVFGSYFFGTHALKYFIQRFETNNLIIFGLLFSLLSTFGALLSSYFFSHQFLVFLIFLVFFIFGSGFVFAPINRLIVEASKKPMGVKMALSSTIGTGCGALASALIAVFYNDTLIMLAIALLIVTSTALIMRFYLQWKLDRMKKIGI